MKNRILLFFLTFLMGSAMASQTVIVDPYFSPYMGSADLITAEQLLIMGWDRLFIKSGRDSTSKVWGRAAEQFLFWYSVNMMVAVTQHEVFGHGYRLRELGVTPKKYSVTPWGGSTSFKLKDSFKVGDLMAVVVAGLEAESILARDLKMKWISSGEIDGRLSVSYTQTQQSLFWYTLITQLGRLKNEEISEGNDIEAYLALQNASYINSNLTIGELTKWSIFNWLDPMTFYGYYAFFYYIAEGKPFSFPMIPLGENVQYLPNAKIAYAPYAPEAYFENFFSIWGKPLYVYLKGGKRSFGLGFAYDHFLRGRRGTVGLRLDVWNQRNFVAPATLLDLEETGMAFRPSLNNRRWGGALSAVSTLNLNGYIALFSEIGGKTSGYLPGYRLDKEVVARIGLRFGPNMLEKN